MAENGAKTSAAANDDIDEQGGEKGQARPRPSAADPATQQQPAGSSGPADQKKQDRGFVGFVVALIVGICGAIGGSVVTFLLGWWLPEPPAPRPLTAVIKSHQSPIKPNERIVFSAIDTVTDHPVSDYDWTINWRGFEDFGGCLAVGPDTEKAIRIDCGFQTTGSYTVSLAVENSANERDDTETFLHVKCDRCMHAISLTVGPTAENEARDALYRKLLYGVKWKDYEGVLDAPIILWDPDRSINVFASLYEGPEDSRNVDRAREGPEGHPVWMYRPESSFVSDKERYVELLSELGNLGWTVRFKSDEVAISYPPSSPYPPREVDLASHRFIVNAAMPEGVLWTDPVSVGLRDYKPSGKYPSGSSLPFFDEQNLGSTFHQMNIYIPKWARTEFAEPPFTVEMRLIENKDQPLIAYYDLPLPGSPEFDYALQENIAEGEELLHALEKMPPFSGVLTGIPEKAADGNDVWDKYPQSLPGSPEPGVEMTVDEWALYIQARLGAFYELQDHQNP